MSETQALLSSDDDVTIYNDVSTNNDVSNDKIDSDVNTKYGESENQEKQFISKKFQIKTTIIKPNEMSIIFKG